jgi:hypothetical protein
LDVRARNGLLSAQYCHAKRRLFLNPYLAPQGGSPKAPIGGSKQRVTFQAVLLAIVMDQHNFEQMFKGVAV